MSMATVLGWVNLILLTVGAILLAAARKGVEVAAGNAAADAVTRLTWSGELARELQKVRGTERQEARLTSYGDLWARMRPTAIYDRTPFTRAMVADLAESLSDWYFSATGGLLLTTPVRELYFALQNLLHEVGAGDDWTGRRTEATRTVFVEFLERSDLGAAKAFMVFLDQRAVDGWPPDDIVERARKWRADIQRIPPLWSGLEPEVRFAIVQQVSSVLRTALSADVESRLR
jgi:hypothetical protein